VLATNNEPDNSGLAWRSSRHEKLLEYHLVAQLGTELYHRGIDFCVLRDDVDSDGRDLLIEANGIFRHIQLKAMVRGGKRADVTVHRRLAARRSACVIWYEYDPATLELGPFRWLGGAPDETMPDIGDRIATHTRHNRQGVKGERSEHRIVSRGKFDRLKTLAELTDRLFGPASPEPLH
jgi:hypothetical protein